MPTEVLLPKLGFSMNEGTLTEWLAENGSPVIKGQRLFAQESDKSTNEVEGPASGEQGGETRSRRTWRGLGRQRKSG